MLRRSRRLATGAAVLAMLLLVGQVVSADTLEYAATSISPAATVNPNGNEITVTNPVSPNAQISFVATVEPASGQGQGRAADYPVDAEWQATGWKVYNESTGLYEEYSGTPAGAGVAFDNPTHQFQDDDDSHDSMVTITAPSAAGKYSVHVNMDTDNGTGLGIGHGFTVYFEVAQGCLYVRWRPHETPPVVYSGNNVNAAIVVQFRLYTQPSPWESQYEVTGGTRSVQVVSGINVWTFTAVWDDDKYLVSLKGSDDLGLSKGQTFSGTIEVAGACAEQSAGLVIGD